MSKYTILLGYTTFLFFVIQISAMAGATLIKNAPSPPAAPSTPGALELLSFILNNIVFFFNLMAISTDFLIFGAVVLTPFIIFLLWIIIELIADLIPG